MKSNFRNVLNTLSHLKHFLKLIIILFKLNKDFYGTKRILLTHFKFHLNTTDKGY